MDTLQDKTDILKELHRDLARKYQLHKVAIEETWRSLGRKKREQVIKAGCAEGVVLKTPMDRSLGVVCHIIPEWNLRDLAELGSDYLLDHLKHRATNSLCDQYASGVHGGPGDAEFIINRDILELRSSLKKKHTQQEKDEDTARMALRSLSIDPKPEKLPLTELASRALDHKTSLEEYVDLCRTEPTCLAPTVNLWYFSRPELVPDEKGRVLPVITDKYISIAIFEMVHNAVIGAAVWDYLHRLLQTLVDNNKQNDRAYRTIILQEIANISHFEYRRVQNLFKRFVQMGTGSKHFKRVFGAYDNGHSRVIMKVKPDTLTRVDPQLHYILSLCRVETDISRAIDWIQKLDQFHQTRPLEEDRMCLGEFNIFGELAIITSFFSSLSRSLSLPPINSKKGQTYITRLKSLGNDIESLKTKVDLLEFATPINNLLEPGMTEGAINVLDQCIVENAGADLALLYKELNEDCLLDMQERNEEQKATAAQNANTVVELRNKENICPAVQVEQRKEKQKTRPAHSSIYSSVAPASPANSSIKQFEEHSVFKVKSATFEIFTILLFKPETKKSIHWSAFVAAMSDMKFSILPKFGSVYTFLPPHDCNVQKSFTFHRPHGSRIEGFGLLWLGRRLKRVYGWDERSFSIAKDNKA
ncbi:hypothetical protein EYZ11_005572 [Aspergillus tanneri]|uniref:Uncharacterized protein n=1 Tax=Aspergillus tanneri TaxID=1220188 RepID=A0A4S3JHS7_9EURO|nr:hypothetical protein EYZ11_005572 [Aspergillus tanneri]